MVLMSKIYITLISVYFMVIFPMKQNIPKKLPVDMEFIIEDLRKSKNKRECLTKAYLILTSKYPGSRVKTYVLFHKAFNNDVNKLWRESFLHCTSTNYLLRILLIKSGLFKDEDIIPKWTLVYYLSPHQYLNIKLDKKHVNVDLWGKSYGIKFGDYARGFH